MSEPKPCCGAYGKLHSYGCASQTYDELKEQLGFYYDIWLSNQKALFHDRRRAFHEVNKLRGQLAILKHENNKLRKNYEKAIKWKSEDPRMLREQIRLSDIAFNVLRETCDRLDRELIQWRECASFAVDHMRQMDPLRTLDCTGEAIDRFDELKKAEK